MDQRRAGRSPRQAFCIGRDSRCQVLGLKARQRHGQHERCNAKCPPCAEQTVDEQIGAPDDQGDAARERDEAGRGGHPRLDCLSSVSLVVRGRARSEVPNDPHDLGKSSTLDHLG